MQAVLDRIGPDGVPSSLMVGDRKYDVIGARETHVPVAIVGFGYGTEAERQAFPPDYFAPDVPALQQIILGDTNR